MKPRAVFWEQATAGGNYVRCQLPARYLPGQSLQFEASDLAEDKNGEAWFPRQQAPVAVWAYPNNKIRGVAMAHMQDLGTRVMVEVDDNYLVPYGGPKVMQSLSWGEEEYRAHRRICEWVDGIIVATEYLAERYREVNDRVFVCRNAVDPIDWPEGKDSGGKLRIGWAASDSHITDAPLVSRAIRWASGERDVQIILMGNLFGLLAKRSAAWWFPATWSPWTDTMADYRHNVSFMDVGLCPLIDNEWSKGKSDLKALETAVAGGLPIVSRSEAYRPWWEQSDPPCLIAETAAGFHEAVRWCVTHRDEVKALARRAQEYVLTERAFPAAVAPWQDAVNAVVGRQLVAA